MTVSSLELVVDFGWLKLVMIWLMNFGWCEQAMISSLDLTGATYNSIGNTMILGEDGEYICYIFFVLKFLEFVFNTIMPCEYRVLINNITLLFGTFNSTFELNQCQDLTLFLCITRTSKWVMFAMWFPKSFRINKSVHHNWCLEEK